MSEPNEKIEAVQVWINELRQKQIENPLGANDAEALLSEMLDLIQQSRSHASSGQTLSETQLPLFEGQRAILTHSQERLLKEN